MNSFHHEVIQWSIKIKGCPLRTSSQEMLLRYDFHGPLTQSKYEAKQN